MMEKQHGIQEVATRFLGEPGKYIGELDGGEIWQIENHGWFDQFGFVAVCKNS